MKHSGRLFKQSFAVVQQNNSRNFYLNFYFYEQYQEVRKPKLEGHLFNEINPSMENPWGLCLRDLQNLLVVYCLRIYSLSSKLSVSSKKFQFSWLFSLRPKRYRLCLPVIITDQKLWIGSIMLSLRNLWITWCMRLSNKIPLSWGKLRNKKSVQWRYTKFLFYSKIYEKLLSSDWLR